MISRTIEGGPFGGQVINVKQHGALGDGSTNDTPALEAIIDASHEGDAFYFPPGTYLLSAPLWPKAHQVFFSFSDMATLKPYLGVTGVVGFTLFVVRSGTAAFHNLTLDLAKESTGEPADPRNASGIVVRAGSDGAIDIVIDNCRIRNAHGHGIRIDGTLTGSHRVIVRDTLVEKCGVVGLSLTDVSNVRVDSSRLEECRNGMLGRQCSDVVVRAVTASLNRRHGIAFLFSQNWHVDACAARGNGTDGDGWGIAAGGDAQPAKMAPNNNFTITNNVCERNKSGGITLDPTIADEQTKTQPQRARVSGNVSQYAVDHHGINVTHACDVVVTDNVCTDNEQGCGIAITSSSHVLAQANTCMRNRYGIGVFSAEGMLDPGHHVIGVNLLHDNVKANLHLSAGDDVLGEVRTHGLHGAVEPEGTVPAQPGTLFEWHNAGQGALYVKQSGSNSRGWVRLPG
jgi:hypothetical protein